MFCSNCGSNVENGTKFCPNCGAVMNAEAPAPVSAPTPAYQQEVPQYTAPAQQSVPGADENTTPILVFGILSLALGGILGIIFGAIALNKGNAFLNKYGMIYGKAKVGRILGKVGLILGIVSTILIIIYCAIFIPLIINAANYVNQSQQHQFNQALNSALNKYF